jgi:2-keto-4-pentenoate hydratase/2-oxohepta-3-ene-1,7-dioic acid hydratase in catechol pathway
MKLASYSEKRGAGPARIGALVDRSVVDLDRTWRLLRRGQSDAEGFPNTMRELIAGGRAALDRAVRALDFACEREGVETLGHPLAAVELLPPVADPAKFFCIGKNSRGHRAELTKAGLLGEMPAEPTAFIKLNAAMVGNDASVVRPADITTLDYEPELTFVLSRTAVGVKASKALDFVFGITLCNDLTAREVQKREAISGTRFWTAKNMPGFGPVGPFIMTMDEIADPHDLWITCDVNGERRIRAHTGDVVYRIGDVLEHFTRHVPFYAGDLVAMGAPQGVAVGHANARELYLKPGDVVDVAFEGIAPALTTRIVAPLSSSKQ